MKKLDLKINWYMFTVKTIISLFICALFGFFIYLTTFSNLLYLKVIVIIISSLIILIAFINSFILSFLTYKYYGYQINEENIHVIKGVLFKSETIIPIKRIQHVEVLEGPIQLLFKQASVLIYTAGSALNITGLSKEKALEVSKSIEGKLVDYLNLDEELRDE